MEVISKRAQALSCKAERDRVKMTNVLKVYHVLKTAPVYLFFYLNVYLKATESIEPAYRTILDLISQAVNPLKLAQMDVAFMPQL